MDPDVFQPAPKSPGGRVGEPRPSCTCGAGASMYARGGARAVLAGMHGRVLHSRAQQRYV